MLTVAAIVATGFLVASLRDHDRCADARSAVFAGDRSAVAGVRATCRGATALIDVAGALHAQRRDREALALARAAARLEPDNAAAWRAVAQTAQTRAEARAAERRRRTLDPLGRASL